MSTRKCWGCNSSGAVLNWQGAPIECPICDTGSPFAGMSKAKYKAYFNNTFKRPNR